MEKMMEDDPVGSSCKSVVLNMIAGVSGTVYQLTNYLSGAPIDATSGMYMPLQMSQTVRQTVGNNIYEGLGGGILGTAGNIAYQGIMGVGDYGLATMIGLGIVLMGMEGYAQTGQDAAERGLSASDIQAEAVAGAIAEIITERILSGIPGGKSAASHGIQLLKAGASNAVNNAIVWQLDKYIAEDLSYEELLLQSYIAAGEGKEEARQQVIQDRLKQAAMDFGVGAVTAGIVDVANKTMYTIKNIDNGLRSIDGFRIIDNKVDGKIPFEDYVKYREISVHNPNSDTMTLGKYDGGGPTSYIVKAGNTTYFDMGKAWNEITKTYELDKAGKQMFQYFNRPALDDAVTAGKDIRFSHNPNKVGDCALLWEWNYLQDKYGYTDLIKKGDFWYAIK